MLVLPEAPNLHYLTGRPPVTPFLWASSVRGVPGALEMTRTSVADLGPAFVVLTRPPAIVDPTGRLATLIERNYRVVARRGPARVLVRRPRPSVTLEVGRGPVAREAELAYAGDVLQAGRPAAHTFGGRA